MTDEERTAVLRFGKANLQPIEYDELVLLASGEWADDEYACRGFVYDHTPDDDVGEV